MNIKDLLAALHQFDQNVGLNTQPMPPPMGPGLPTAPGPGAQWYDWANYVLGGSSTPGSIKSSLTQGQPGADYRQATGDYASNQLAAGADPGLPPLAQLNQQSMATGRPPQGPQLSDPNDPSFFHDLGAAASGLAQQGPAALKDIAGAAPQIGSDLYALARQAAGNLPGMPQPAPQDWNMTDAMRGKYGQDVPLGGPALQPSDAQIADMSRPGGTGQLPTIPGGAPPMGPGRGGDEKASEGIWDSILKGLSPNPNADPTQNAEIDNANGKYTSPLDVKQWLHDSFGIGKGEPGAPQKGILEQYADQMNNAPANAPKGGKGKAGGGGSGAVTTYGLGQYQEPPPAPHEAVPAAMDLSKVLDEIRKAEPQRVPLNVTKGTNILEGIAHGMASAAGHGFGTQLLAGAAGGLGGEIGYAHDIQRNEENFQHAMQDFHYRVAEGELHKSQMDSEHNRLQAEIDYKNQLNDYTRQVGIIDAHKPQAQMTAAGLVISDIDPHTGQYRMRVDSRPIDHIIEARMALKGVGASPATISSFTGQATGATGGKARPEDAALNIGIQLLDRPDLWPGLFGDKFQEFNMKVQGIMGKDTAYGAMTGDQKGKIGEAQTMITTRSAIARMLQNEILADPSQEMAKRAVGLLSGQAVIGAKNQVQANPFGQH